MQRSGTRSQHFSRVFQCTHFPRQRVQQPQHGLQLIVCTRMRVHTHTRMVVHTVRAVPGGVCARRALRARGRHVPCAATAL